MVALFVCFGFFAAQIHLEEDINQLMPSSKNEDGTTKLAFASLKIKDKTFLLFSTRQPKADAGSVERLTETCDAFVDTLLQRDSLTQTVGDVFYRLPDDLMADAVDYGMAHLPAYIDTSAYARFDSLLTLSHMRRQMEQNREELEGEFGEMFPELIQLDPIGMRSVLASAFGDLAGTPSDSTAQTSAAASYQVVDNHFFVADSTVLVAFITPKFSATNTGQGSAMFQLLNEEIAQFQASHPDVDINYHGTPASGFNNSTQIKHDLTTTVSGALLLVLLFLLFCFRRWDTIPLLLLPVAFGTVFGLSMMYFIRGTFSLLALGIGAVVLGVAMSYVLHVLTHHQYVADTDQLLRDQVKPVLLGCLTTIGSFSALIFIQTDLLRDFGLFAAFAILGTTLFSLAYLPQMMDGKRREQAFPPIIDKLSGWPIDRNRPLIAAIVVVVVVCVGFFFYGGTNFDADMHNLGYDEPMVARSEQLLRDKTYTGDKQKYFASQGKTMEEAIANFGLLRHKLDSLQELGLVKSYTPTDEIFVSKRRQQERIDAWHRYWTPERQTLVRQLIAQTAPAAGLNAEAFETFFEAAGGDYEPAPLYEAGLIPEGFQSTLMEQSYGGDYLCFTSVRCQNDSVRSSESDYSRICDAIAREKSLLVLDTYYYTTDTLLQMSSDFDVLQWLSMAFVLLVLWLSFHRDLRLTLLGFMPILLSWLVVLGMMNLFGVRFNLISIIISTFIFGIGVDYSIFVLNGLLDKNLSFHKTAILLSAVILVVTVSSMLIAQHPAIRSVGFSTLVGLVAAVVLSSVLQPAIFRLLEKDREKHTEA
ncbi:MAG: MMPL family transporter [Prevotella sp.]|nr:MMPL family transporter [Prevotella sp.]